tara:strand:+ start:207 stop:332 length:126 start_codon:yes stop_codon:yes gene_type:complete
VVLKSCAVQKIEKDVAVLGVLGIGFAGPVFKKDMALLILPH